MKISLKFVLDEHKRFLQIESYKFLSNKITYNEYIHNTTDISIRASELYLLFGGEDLRG